MAKEVIGINHMRSKVLPKIPQKQQEIILLLFKFRFLNRTQIQKLLGHKSHSLINSWLKDLTEKEYLGRIYSNTFPANLQPAIYYLATGGVSYLRGVSAKNDPTVLKNLYKEKLRSKSFVDHCLLLTDIYLSLKDKETEKLKFNLILGSDYRRRLEGDLLEELRPAAYLIQTKLGRKKSFFIEIVADLPTRWLRQIVKKYLRFYQGGEWAQETGKNFPTILVICPNYRVLDYVRQYVKRQLGTLDEPDLKVSLTTTGELTSLGLTGNIWQQVNK